MTANAVKLGNQRLALAEHVAAAQDRLDDRGVGRRPADALVLEALHERGVGVARRRRGLVPLRVEPRERRAGGPLGADRLAARQRRQDRLLIVERRRRIVAALDVGAEEPGELDRLARGGEHPVALAGRRRDLDRGAQQPRVGHLRRDRPLPDQLVDPQPRRRRGPTSAAAGGRSRSAGSPRALPARCGPWSGTGACRCGTRRRRCP